jgi:hypothetical protein
VYRFSFTTLIIIIQNKLASSKGISRKLICAGDGQAVC